MNTTTPLRESRVRWTLAGILLLVTTHGFATRFSMSVIAHQLQSDFSLTDMQVGSMLSAFILGYAVMQFPMGIIVDRFGAFRILVLSVLGWSVFTLCSAPLRFLAASQLAGGLFLTRLLTGVSQSGVLTCTIKLLGQWMPSRERASANGLSLMGLGLGGAIAPPLTVWMVAQGGWTLPFWVLGVTGSMIALLLRKTGSEMPEQHSGVSPAELALIRRGEKTESAEPKAARPTPWRVLLASRSVWALSLSYGVSGYTSYVFFTWFYLYLVNVRGMTKTAGGYWAGLPYVAVALGTLAGGRLSDWLMARYGKRTGRLGILLAGETLAAILIVLGGRIENVTVAVLLFSLATGVHLLGQTASWAAAVDLAPSHAGVLFGVMNTVAQIAGTIAPIATPAIALQFGWTAALDFAAAMLALAAVLWLFVHPERPVA
jgi:ACS family glucarate transporter-like MFS transporter